MRILFRLFAALVVLTSFGITASAQDNDTIAGSGNLAALLRFVPDDQAAQNHIQYSDYRAAEAARGIPQVDTAAFMEDTDSFWHWQASLPLNGINHPLSLPGMEAMTEAIGINFADIDQSLTIGSSPRDRIILHGDFDPASVRTALEARQFNETDVSGTSLWCPARGCDDGFRSNLQNRYDGDPFGGSFGQSYIRALAGNVFFGAGDPEVVEEMRAAGVDGQNSAANHLTFQAALAALDGEQTLRSALFVSAQALLMTGQLVEQYAGSDTAAELRGGADDLPLYEIVFFGDLFDSKGDTSLTGIVYADESEATTAAAILDSRIRIARSGNFDMSWMEVYEERNITFDGTSVLHVPSANRFVVIARWTNAPVNDEPNETGRYSRSGGAFLLNGSYYVDDLLWLQPTGSVS